MKSFLAELDAIQKSLWSQAVLHAGRDPHSEVAALYVDSLNQVIDIQALRIAVAIQTREPPIIWLVLYGITGLSMMGLGYQTGIAGSKRSRARPILAASFAMMFLLIAALDRPNAILIPVSQQPLIDLYNSMAAP